MNLVVIHHHLRRGGVTRVIENHLRALGAGDRPFERAVVLYGGGESDLPLDAGIGAELVAVEGLGYAELGAPADERLAKTLLATLGEHGCPPDKTLVHWHNHSLGKNASATLAAGELARSGYRSLLQIHDFAEDFRPENYTGLRQSLSAPNAEALAERLYPQSPGIHYAVLNGRDRGTLAAAGVAPERLHLLPNPVAAPPSVTDAAEAKRAVEQALGIATGTPLMVYPVRGIRRKNLGELLLWSVLIEDACFLQTLAPANPVELPSFQGWRELAEHIGAPCRLGLPRDCGLGFGEVLAAADAVLTTSVAEGFGMVFLEAWLAGRMLLGRDLPEITADFRDEGLDLAACYTAQNVPTAWVDQQRFVEEVGRLYSGVLAGYGIDSALSTEIEDQLSARLAAQSIDFAALPSSLQRSVIEQAHGDAAARAELLLLNPQCRRPDADDTSVVAENAAVVARSFSIEASAARLVAAYRSVMNSPAHTRLEPLRKPGAVLDGFLSLDRFHPLRVES
ncbi:MAG: hypothetical protein AAGA92_13810 [Planctomycetota bacterium]